MNSGNIQWKLRIRNGAINEGHQITVGRKIVGPPYPLN